MIKHRFSFFSRYGVYKQSTAKIDTRLNHDNDKKVWPWHLSAKKRCVIITLSGFILFLLFAHLYSEVKSTENHVFLQEENGSKALHTNLAHCIPHGLTLAVATLVLNQGKYLQEWIEFHMLVGVQYFIIFDDGSMDDTVSVIMPYIKSRTAVLIHGRESFYECSHRDPDHINHLQAPCQEVVFNYARSQLIGRTMWMGNFDVDEFFYTPKHSHSLLFFLKHIYKDYDRIRVIGLVFGSNNHSMPVNGPVIQAYTRRAKIDPALFGYYFYNEYLTGFLFGHKQLYRPERVSSCLVHDTWCWNCHTKTILPFESDIRMNHYQYKSRKERHTKSLVNGNAVLDIDPVREAILDEEVDSDIQFLLPRLILRLKKSV